jgi:hypothetical protein
LLAQVGCAKEARPGVTYSVTALSRGSKGQVAPQGPPTHVETAVVQQVQEIHHDRATLSLLVRKTEYGRATFDVTFPDKTTQRIRVKTGQTQDVLPEGQTLGLRIEVHECR